MSSTIAIGHEFGHFDDSGSGALDIISAAEVDARIGSKSVTASYFGALGNGTANDQPAIQLAIDAVEDAGGGKIILPPGVYLCEDKLTLKSNVVLEGIGDPYATQLKLANGVNKTLLEGKDFLTLSGGTSSAGISRFGVRNLMVDGDKANNDSPAANEGHGVAFYGHQFLLDNVWIVNTAREGLHTEFRGSSADSLGYNGRVRSLLVYKANEHGFYSRVSDSHISDINISAAGSGAVSTYDGLHVAASVRASDINVWSSEATNFTRYPISLNGDGSTLCNVHVEAGALANLLIDGLHNMCASIFSYNARGDQNIILAGNYNYLDATMNPGFWAGTKGVKIGDSVLGSSSQNTVNIRHSGMTGGAINFINDGGRNQIRSIGFAATPALYTGTSNSTNEIFEQSSDNSASTISVYKKAVAAAVAAAGSSSATATVLTAHRVDLTAASTGLGVRFSGSYVTGGTCYELLNTSVLYSILVYPHTAGNHTGLGSNIPYYLRPGQSVVFNRQLSGGWGITPGTHVSPVTYSAAGAIDIGVLSALLSNATGSTFAVTLAAPTAALVAEGREMAISMIAGDGTNTVTLALTNVLSDAGYTSATFDAAGETLRLRPIQSGASTFRWELTGFRGVTLS